VHETWIPITKIALITFSLLQLACAGEEENKAILAAKGEAVYTVSKSGTIAIIPKEIVRNNLDALHYDNSVNNNNCTSDTYFGVYGEDGVSLMGEIDFKENCIIIIGDTLYAKASFCNLQNAERLFRMALKTVSYRTRSLSPGEIEKLQQEVFVMGGVALPSSKLSKTTFRVYFAEESVNQPPIHEWLQERQLVKD
jgi:hypothetical protein